MPSLSVRSEVGRLRRVLVHEPGPEIDRMVPDMMEELLFDDILYGDGAREEHQIFRAIMDKLGVLTFDMRDLLIESLEQEGACDWLLAALLDNVAPGLEKQLRAASAEELSDILVAGLRWSKEADDLAREDLFEVLPTPNLCFQRDPQIVVGDGVLFSSMATPTRTREVLISRTVFRFHPDFRRAPVYLDPLLADSDRPLYLGMHRPRFEGGDVMVLSPDVIAVGYSERTNRSGVRQLVQALRQREGGPRWLVVAALPHKRAYMHLDTVLTQIDQHQCLAYLPVVRTGHDDSASVYEFDLHDTDPRPRPTGDLLTALRARGVDLQPLACGGDDPVAQQREQWTDGANALALAPGVIVLYERNVRTVETLDRHGYRIVEAQEILLGRTRVSLDQPEPTCILLPSHELSRARGGPHCLSHALERDGLEPA